MNSQQGNSQSNLQANLPIIATIQPDQRAEALNLLLGRLAEDQRRQQIDSLLKAEAAGQQSFGGLLVATRGERIVGAIWAQPQPGKTASVSTPRLVGYENSSTAEALLRATIDWLDSAGVALAQAALPIDAKADAALLEGSGFRHVADLLFMVCETDAFPTPRPNCPLSLTPYSDDLLGQLTDIVRRTYVETLDCPALDGLREMSDVLEGYRATGVFDSARWLLASHGGQDVGCLLLADHPGDRQWELVYMGLVPEARGSGWGLDMVRHAQWLTSSAGRERLVLAVDAANDPAIKMYAAAGFHSWERRAVFLRVAPCIS